MRRAPWALLAVTSTLLQGCPVFPDDVSGCGSDSQCPSGYTCDGSSFVCVRPSRERICREPSECGAREICGSDGRCHSGSCTVSGCVAGYACEAPNGIWTCVAEGAAGAPGAAGAASGGASGAAGSR